MQTLFTRWMAFSRFWQNCNQSLFHSFCCPEAGLRLPQGCPKVSPWLPKGCPEFAPKLPWTCPEVARVCLEVAPKLIRGCLRLLEVAQRLPRGCSKVASRLPRGCSKVGPLMPWGCPIPKLPKGFDPQRKLQHKLMRLSTAVCSLKILISIGNWGVVGLKRKATPTLLYKFIYPFDLELCKKLFCQVFLTEISKKTFITYDYVQLCQLFLPRQFPIISKLIKQRKMNTNHDNKNVN